MNKLVIVGNGFDLAHGLPTSYKDFIDDFWKEIKHNYKDEKYRDFVYINESFPSFMDDSEINSFNSFEDYLIKYSIRYGYRYDQENNVCWAKQQNYKFQWEEVLLFKFESSFFRKINLRSSIQNWVDIENEYYSELKIIAQKKDLDKRQSLLSDLNNQFENIKKLFEDYLDKKTASLFNFQKINDNVGQVLSHFEIRHKGLEKDYKPKYLQEFTKEDHQDLIDYDNQILEAQNEINSSQNISSKSFSGNNLFLNFNYTFTVDKYINTFNQNHRDFYGSPKHIQIHGRLNDLKNEMNFGFGDEMDSDYAFIENLNENQFLKYFKSFSYSQNSNYKTLLDYIESEKFQVYIMGHSCGLSDRTLLNTIFEHENCRSIKIFYHQREDESDNYTEIIQNISRHFNDKKLMRSKIVNKSLCQPLPQNIRFQEKS